MSDSTKNGDREWRLFTCTECENNPYQFAELVDVNAPYGAGSELDYCPRCESYEGFDSGSAVKVEDLHGEEYAEWLKRVTT